MFVKRKTKRKRAHKALVDDDTRIIYITVVREVYGRGRESDVVCVCREREREGEREGEGLFFCCCFD